MKTYRNGLTVSRCSSWRRPALLGGRGDACGEQRLAGLQDLLGLLDRGEDRDLLLLEAGFLRQARDGLLDGLEVGEDQLGVDRLDVVLRRDLAVDVDDVLVLEGPDDLADRVGLADVREELVAQALALEAPRTMPAMSTKSTVAGRSRWELKISASLFRRGSGTPTTPTFGSIVANG